jgi:hypothetical protein
MLRIINGCLEFNDGTHYDLSTSGQKRVLQGLSIQLSEGSLTKSEYNKCLELINAYYEGNKTVKPTKKSIERHYGVRLERGDFDMCDDYRSWVAFVDTPTNIVQVAWCDTLAEIIHALDKKKDEIKQLKESNFDE